jgi:hypothetical protein
MTEVRSLVDEIEQPERQLVELNSEYSAVLEPGLFTVKRRNAPEDSILFLEQEARYDSPV